VDQCSSRLPEHPKRSRSREESLPIGGNELFTSV
jgi:hypothetical protein